MSGTTSNPNPDTTTSTPNPGDVAAAQGGSTSTNGATGTTPPAEGATGSGDTGSEGPVRLPDDHPLVTAYARVKDELATKADRLSDVERDAEAARSEVATVTEQLAEADRQVQAIPATVAGHLRDHLVAVHNISAEDADLLLTADDPDTLLRQVDRLVERRRARTGHVPTQGTGDPGARVSGYEVGRERGQARYGNKQ